MDIVTVFRRVPAPVIGMIGVRPAPTFEAQEAVLDWLETTGLPVERVDPATDLHLLRWPAAASLWQAHGESVLPMVLVNDRVASAGVSLCRSTLARAVGHARRSAVVATPAA